MGRDVDHVRQNNSDVCMAWCLFDDFRLKHYNTTLCKVERNWGIDVLS